MPISNAEASKRYRLRKAGLLPPAFLLSCTSCGKDCSGKYGNLCNACWLKTPEGQEWNRLKIQAYRQKKKQVV